jgi:hypothetical protein
MRYIIATLLLSIGLLYGQAKPEAKDPPKLPAIQDKDRADFLLVQRDFLGVQKQYEDAFKNEPKVAQFNASLQKLQKECSDGGGQLDLQTVQCTAKPAPPAPEKK